MRKSNTDVWDWKVFVDLRIEVGAIPLYSCGEIYDTQNICTLEKAQCETQLR